MAEAASLKLMANGTQIEGESTTTSLGRENEIECIALGLGVATAREKGSGMATGRRQWKPITLRKRVNKASPLIMKALCNNEVIEATFRFFRPNPAGDGTTEHYLTIELGEARIASVDTEQPDCLDPTSSEAPMIENVGIVFHTITMTYEPSGATHMDNWRENQ